MESRLTTEERLRLEDIGRQIANQAQRGLRDASPAQLGLGAEAKRRVDSIADKEMAADRAEVLRFLGLDPESDSALYVFVSWSMPLEMLRAYAVEAMWSGGSLVFKGIPRGRDFADYIREDLAKLVYGKGAAASIAIDPRLFDAYQVSVVPTIVLAENKDDVPCTGKQRQAREDARGKTTVVTYQVCDPASANSYYKMAGAVTLDYALSEFRSHGAKSAGAHLNALAKGYGGKAVRRKAIEPFKGQWQDAISPSDLMASRGASSGANTANQGRP